MDPETRALAARSLYTYRWDDPSTRAEANQAIASSLRFREQAVRQLPVEKRVQYLARAVRPDDGLASSLLMALHLDQRKELLETFLNELGIPQKEGVIASDHQLEPADPEQLAPAVDRLCERFPDEEVQLYLFSLMAMDPDVWGGLAGIVARLDRSGARDARSGDR
jgi:hypothetical protein